MPAGREAEGGRRSAWHSTALGCSPVVVQLQQDHEPQRQLRSEKDCGRARNGSSLHKPRKGSALKRKMPRPCVSSVAAHAPRASSGVSVPAARGLLRVRSTRLSMSLSHRSLMVHPAPLSSCARVAKRVPCPMRRRGGARDPLRGMHTKVGLAVLEVLLRMQSACEKPTYHSAGSKEHQQRKVWQVAWGRC